VCVCVCVWLTLWSARIATNGVGCRRCGLGSAHSQPAQRSHFSMSVSTRSSLLSLPDFPLPPSSPLTPSQSELEASKALKDELDVLRPQAAAKAKAEASLAQLKKKVR